MVYGPQELHSLCGGARVRPPVLRAALRHNAASGTPAPRGQERPGQERPGQERPGQERPGQDPAQGRVPSVLDPFYLADKARLQALAGRRCPLCRMAGRFATVEFDGTIVACPSGHAWSSPAGAESEVLSEGEIR